MHTFPLMDVHLKIKNVIRNSSSFINGQFNIRNMHCTSNGKSVVVVEKKEHVDKVRLVF